MAGGTGSGEHSGVRGQRFLGTPQAATAPGPRRPGTPGWPGSSETSSSEPDSGRRPSPDGGGSRSWLVLLGVVVVYAAIAVVAYLPTLPLNGSHTQICTCGDTAQEVWFLSWVPFALAHGHSLFYSNWLLYPAGVNLTDNTAMTLLGILAAPVTVLAGPIAAYNLVMRLGFTLSALAMFVTVRRFVRWWPAAFAAGLLYGFSPFMVGQGLSHEFLVFAPIPPLVFGIMADLLGRQRMPARRAGLLLGVLFAAQFLIASETFVIMALFAVIGVGVALCYRSIRQRAGPLLQAAGWAAGVCVILIAYPVYYFLAGPQHIVGSPHPLAQLYTWHGDLLGALLPNSLMRFAPPSLVHISSTFVNSNLQENGTYLGLPLVLIAAGLAIAYWRRPVTAIAAVLAVASYALSLGSKVYIANHPTNIPGPFTLLTRLPLLQDIEPARFSLFTALFIAIVLGTGLDQLRWPRAAAPGSAAAATTGWRRPLFAAAVGVAALLPLLPHWPYPAGPVATPPFFTSTAVDRIPRGAVVVTFPFPEHRFNEAMVWQAESSIRFRLLGGTAFFVPGPGRRGINSNLVRIHPMGIQRAFELAFFGTPPGSRPALQPNLVTQIRADLRRYHVDAIVIEPYRGRNTALAARYVIAATGQRPESAGGVLGWFGLAHHAT